MIELVLFLLDPAPAHLSASDIELAATSAKRAPILCDDRSSPFGPDGNPNWDCELAGCTPFAPVCWSYRLDFCYDENGDDTGECAWGGAQTCNSRWSCFKLWAGCDGEYQCDQASWPGCGSGSCTPVPALKPTTPAASPATTPGFAHDAPMCSISEQLSPLTTDDTVDSSDGAGGCDD